MGAVNPSKQVNDHCLITAVVKHLACTMNLAAEVLFLSLEISFCPTLRSLSAYLGTEGVGCWVY